MFDFSNKTAMITGAASGIGLGTSRYFLDAGANVVMGDLNGTALADAATELGRGERVLSVPFDAADPESAGALVGRAVECFGSLDFLVVAAAVYEEQLVSAMTDAQWRKTLGTNLDGAFYIIRRAIPVIRSGGAIVTVASTAAHQGGSYAHSHYGATKGGLLAFTRGLARDLAPHIRVNAVSPGTIETPMVAKRIASQRSEIESRIPLGRVGTPADVASVIAFLCSEAAGYVLGETVMVNGGSYMA